ncbi:MAG: hypothetical protein E6471_34795, partial [Bradyrhizobium sp.]|nr:hypothetical protein [Bradyrhizobium sp.]
MTEHARIAGTGKAGLGVGRWTPEGRASIHSAWYARPFEIRGQAARDLAADSSRATLDFRS